MSALRDEIRAILREELAALRGEADRVVETVRIGSSEDLNRFARDLLARAASGDFAARVADGSIRFALSGPTPAAAHPPRPIVTGPPSPKAGAALDKALVTERDISELAAGVRTLLVSKRCRLTPLARDEARRKGIRIERTEA
ncbi:MAG: hypothetical protein ACK5MQ_01655 [Pikeienuella sp.]